MLEIEKSNFRNMRQRISGNRNDFCIFEFCAFCNIKQSLRISGVRDNHNDIIPGDAGYLRGCAIYLQDEKRVVSFL